MKKTEKIIPVSVGMPEGFALRIRVLAAQQNKSRSQLVREVLENALAKDGLKTEEEMVRP